MKSNILSNPKYQPLFSIFCSVGWSLAYPLIKLGYSEFQIYPSDTAGKIMFAGIRFFFAGAILMCVAIKGKKVLNTGKSNLLWIFLFSVVNITLHYLFSYIGLGYIPSSRGTIIDSMGGFFLIILSCLIFKYDSFTKNKLFGCLLGFAGILLINTNQGNIFYNFSLMGDGFVFLNAVCCAFGGIITRVVSQKNDMTYATALSMLIGGALLCLTALCFSFSCNWNISIKGISILVALILISAVCFGIYNQLLAYHSISKVAIYNALIPILGVVFSAIILGEPLRIEYLFAGALVALGVVTINKDSR